MKRQFALTKMEVPMIFLLLILCALFFYLGDASDSYRFILLVPIILFVVKVFSTPSHKEESDESKQMLIEIERKRLEMTHASIPHFFSKGVCKNCGISTSAAHHFGWDACKEDRDQTAIPHLFADGICKYCGVSISAARHFEWYSCEKNSHQTAMSHLFIGGICKNCGTSIPAIQHFGWDVCEKNLSES